MEYYYRSCRCYHDGLRYYHDSFEFWINEDALVSSETDFSSWFGIFPLLGLREKLLLIKKLNGETLSTSNVKLRQINEIATFILFLVVFTVILKSSVIEYWWQLITGFFVLVFLIMMTVKLVNKNKKK